MQNANALLQDFTGSANWFRHPLTQILYTEGVQHAMETMECHWFGDLVMSYQTKTFLKANEFQVWILMRMNENSFLASCEDGNDKVILTQKIPFSDFKHDTLTFWLVDGVLLLPSEY